MNIFVSNLPFKLDQDSLRELFQNFGEVSSCKIMTDKFSGRSRGFGFVEMPNDAEAQKAIDGLNDQEVDGRNMSVSVAKPRTEGGGGNRKFGGDKRERW
ncbi:MAG: RNA-binding protein [Bacteroidia bacterium]|jgi:RNA recognition motif-containing protein|nr:RNA-binding protein [Bacteroidia bacterium]